MDTLLSSQVAETIDQLFPKLVELRRGFHRFPELSNQERETGRRIEEVLRRAGLEVTAGLAGYGVVGFLRGEAPERAAASGPTIAFRADMDALPINEENPVPYRSEVPGVMHACGHDGHMTIVLGAALVLTHFKDRLKGNVKFLFQPAEEASPAGGAARMIEAGVLRDPSVDAIFGLHLWPNLEEGTIGVKEGPMMSGSDRFTLTLTGKGGHAAMPYQADDAILAASQVVSSLYTVLGRKNNPSQPGVISIGTIHGGTRYNVIADQVVIEGTVRSATRDLQMSMPERIEAIIDGIARAYGVKHRLDYTQGYPPVVTSPAQVDRVVRAARFVLGTDGVVRLSSGIAMAEDFAHYLTHVPGAFILLGTGKRALEGEPAPLHHPCFGFDESMLKIGVRVLAEVALGREE